MARSLVSQPGSLAKYSVVETSVLFWAYSCRTPALASCCEQGRLLAIVTNGSWVTPDEASRPMVGRWMTQTLSSRVVIRLITGTP